MWQVLIFYLHNEYARVGRGRGGENGEWVAGVGKALFYYKCRSIGGGIGLGVTVNLHVLMPYLHRCAIIFAINCLLCLALRCTLLASLFLLASTVYMCMCTYIWRNPLYYDGTQLTRPVPYLHLDWCKSPASNCRHHPCSGAPPGLR